MSVALVYGKNVFATGVERYARALETGLRALGEEVESVPLSRREFRVAGKPVGGFVSLWLARLADRRGPHELVHALDPAVATAQSDVVTVHDLVVETYPEWYQRDLASRLDWRFTRRFARRVPWIVTVSETTRREVIERWGRDPERVIAIPSGIDHAMFRPVESPSRLLAPDRPNLVYVGDDNPRKNLLLAVRALGVVRERTGVSPRFLRLGPSRFPSVREAYQQAARDAGVDLVEPGFVDDAELVAALSGADAFLWPTLAEGFGFPPLEAMACGTPVVALDTPINREVGGAHSRYSVDEPVAMADAIQAMLDAPPAREALIAHAAQFDWRKTAQRVRDVYERARRAK